MRLLRPITHLVLFLSLFTLGAPSSWASEKLMYDDDWWEKQYGKIYDTPQCRDIIPNMNKIRKQDLSFGLLRAPLMWALGMYFSKGECGAPDQDQVLIILTDLAERGEGLSAVYLAQFYHIKFGANAPLTQSWVERTRNAMPQIISKTWRKNFYQPLAKDFQKMGTPFSPQLESVFSWGEGILDGDLQRIYEYGVVLLDDGKNPEDKVLGCRWLYEAQKKGHHQAAYRLARQHILGEGIQQSPDEGSLWLYGSVNKDQDKDALIFASELLEKGDVFIKNLPRSYIALLRAQSLGANVTERLKHMRLQLNSSQLHWAQVDAQNPKYTLAFMKSPDLVVPQKSGIAPRICVFDPQI